jgi:hypothetical protein
LTNDPEELRLKLIADFPEDEKGINRFFKDARKVAAISKKFPKLFRSTETMGFFEKIGYALRRISIGFPMIRFIMYSGEEGMKKGLSKYFSNKDLHQLFFKLRDEFGQTFVIVTHNEELANMADRKLVMVDGLISK